MALEVEGLTVHYGTFAAVRDAKLEIADCEVLALLGPSGSGKSTLLRAITGLEPQVEGSVRWDGEDFGGVPVHRRGFGLVFQDGQLFPHRDVAGNLAFGLRMHQVPKAEHAARIAKLLKLVGLEGYERRRVNELSGLDAGLRDQLAIDVADLLRRNKITALLVTHDQDEAFTLADRVAVLDRGEIRQEGAVRHVWSRPADETVARFLGVTTIADGTAADGVVRCALGETTMPGVRDGELTLGLRPNALRLADKGIHGDVTAVVHRREHVRLVVVIGESTVDAVAPVTTDVKVGDRVSLALDEDGIAVIGR